jgi:excisionase family DNA binding protein
MTDEADVLTLEEAAALLRCNRKTLVEALVRKQLPGKQFGRIWRLSRSALLQSLGASTRPGQERGQ